LKKWMIGAVCLALVGLLAVNGTFASVFDGIFQTVSGILGNPAPESSKNFQVENQFLSRNAQRTALGPIDPAEMILPAFYDADFDWQPQSTPVGGAVYQLWPDEKVSGEIDRFVSVRNMGEEAAFFRTAIAYPDNEDARKWLYFNLDRVQGYTWSPWAAITIDGRPYRMIVATYQQRLEPGHSAPAIPIQLALDSRMESIDAILLGGKLDLRVKTMAIAADDFFYDDENKTPMTALEALDLAVPLPADINQFMPF